MGLEVDKKWASSHLKPLLHPKSHFYPLSDPFQEIDKTHFLLKS